MKKTVVNQSRSKALHHHRQTLEQKKNSRLSPDSIAVHL